MNRFQIAALALLLVGQSYRGAPAQHLPGPYQQPYSAGSEEYGPLLHPASQPISGGSSSAAASGPSWSELLPTQTDGYRPGSLGSASPAPEPTLEPQAVISAPAPPGANRLYFGTGWINPAALIRRLPPVEEELQHEQQPPRKAVAADDFSSDTFTFVNAQNEPLPAPSSSPSVSENRDDSQPLGQAPLDLGDLFQSQSSILLKPGELQLDVGLAYVWQDATGLVALPGPSIALQRIRERTFLMPVSLRYGYRERVEVFANVPFGLAAFERSDPVNRIIDTQGGIGDVSAGFQYELLKQQDNIPNVTASFFVTAPTGSDPFSPSANVASLGTGFWEIGSSLNVIRSLDPVVFFGGVGYRHQFGDHFNNVWIDPGEIYTYSYGIGFAVSDEVAISASMNGYFQTRAEAAGVLIPNSSVEPVSLRLSVSRRTSKCTRYQPFVDLGLNDDAIDFAFGVIFTRDLRKTKVQ